MQRQPHGIIRDRIDPVPAMRRNEKVIPVFQSDHPLTLKLKARGTPPQKHPLLASLIMPESLCTRLAMGMNRLEP